MLMSLSFSSDTIIRCPNLQQGTLARLDKDMLVNSIPRTAAERESKQLSPCTATNRNRTATTRHSYCDNSALVLRQLDTRTATNRIVCDRNIYKLTTTLQKSATTENRPKINSKFESHSLHIKAKVSFFAAFRAFAVLFLPPFAIKQSSMLSSYKQIKFGRYA